MFALYDRQRTGKGQFIDVALLDVAVSCVAGLAVAAEYKVGGIIRGQQGNASYYNFTNCLKAKDGWVMIGITGTAIWRRFLRAIGREDLKEDPRFGNDRLRYESRLAIQSVVEEWLENKPVDEVIRILDRARVPCSKVNNIAEMVNDPQVKARDMLIDMEYPGIGKIPLPGVPIKMSRTPGDIEMPAPEVGEHNQEVYSRLLGFTKEQLAQLKAEGVI
jgi:CoA:oxalate CoA-transferase